MTSLRGALLVAAPALTDPNFQRTVVLITEHSDEGAMGLVFGRLWQRCNRLWMLVGAHTLIDVVAFLGYAVLRGRVGWLP